MNVLVAVSCGDNPEHDDDDEDVIVTDTSTDTSTQTSTETAAETDTDTSTQTDTDTSTQTDVELTYEFDNQQAIEGAHSYAQWLPFWENLALNHSESSHVNYGCPTKYSPNANTDIYTGGGCITPNGEVWIGTLTSVITGGGYSRDTTWEDYGQTSLESYLFGSRFTIGFVGSGSISAVLDAVGAFNNVYGNSYTLFSASEFLFEFEGPEAASILYDSLEITGDYGALIGGIYPGEILVSADISIDGKTLTMSGNATSDLSCSADSDSPQEPSSGSMHYQGANSATIYFDGATVCDGCYSYQLDNGFTGEMCSGLFSE